MKALLHRLPMSGKFLLTLALPLLAVLYFAVVGIVERQQAADDMARLVSLTGLAQRAGDLMHELQRERGMTSGFLGSEGRRFGDELAQQREDVEGRMETFLAYPGGLDAVSNSDALSARLASIQRQWQATAALRRRVDDQRIPTGEAIAHYTGINGDLMGLVGELAHATREGRVSRRLSAYYGLLEAKDLAGIERALLANAFAADAMAPALYRRFMTLIGEEAAFLEAFRALADLPMRLSLDAALSGPDIERLGALRERVIARAARGGFGVDPQQWFEWQTVKIARLKAVEDTMAADVLSTAEALRREARNDLVRYALIAALAAGLAILLAVAIVRSIVGSLRRTLEAIEGRGGDLTQRLAVPGTDELSRLYRAFNESTAGTERLVANIKRGAQSVKIASGEIALGNQDLAQRTEEQSASLVETASSMEQITATVRQTADNARQAETMAGEVNGQALEASEVASRAQTAMTEIHAANQQVTTIVEAIDSIAFQTNLLALNASVEAARAGEHGRGFAVVAAEVRNLASRSAGEAEQIRRLIGNNVAKIDEGEALVSQTSQILETIAGRVKQMTDRVAEITAAATEQSAGVEQINQAMSQLEEVTQQNAALVEQVAQASKSLDGQAEDMAGAIGEFRVDEALAQAADWQAEMPWRRDAEAPVGN